MMSSRTASLLILMCFVAVLVLDWHTPLGYAMWAGYVCAVMLTYWVAVPSAPVSVAAIATGLTLLGLYLSPAGAPVQMAVFNRTVGVAILWIAAWLTMRARSASLSHAARHLAALVESSETAMISQSLDGAIQTWNRGAERLFGYSARDMIGRSLHALVPLDRSKVDGAMLGSLQQGVRVEICDTVWVAKSGARLPVSIERSPIFGETGQVVGMSIVARDLTSLIQMLERQQEQDTRLNLVVSATRTGVWDWDLRTNRMYYSPLWKQSLGYCEDELSDSQEEWIKRLHPDDHERAFALVKRFLAGEIPTYQLEHRLRHRDGTYRWILTDAVLTRDAHGTPIRMTGSHVDITEQKLAQEALRQSEERFRRYFELGLIGMAITSLDKRWVEYNDHLCAIFGYSREELRRLTWAELTCPDDLGADEAQFARMLAGEINHYAMEKRYVHKSGSLVYAIISVSAIRRPDGVIDHFVALVHDITAWRKAEETLRQRDLTLQRFFESAPLMMGVVRVLPNDIEHLSDNHATAAFFGTTAEAMRGQTARGLGAPSAIVDLWLRRYRQCLETRMPVHFEYDQVVVREGGCVSCILSVTVAPISNDASGAAVCSYVADDVTSQRQAELALRQAHELLEARVEERTVELREAHERLQAISRRLITVQESERRRLARDLHDEIGQAVTALKINLQVLRGGGLGAEEAPVRVADSLDLAESLLQVVRHLAMELRPQLLDELGLVEALRVYVARQADRHGWQLQYAAMDEERTLSDELKVTCFRIVQEALTNVARHAQATAVSVTLAIQADKLEVTVVDNGIGFDAASIPSRPGDAPGSGLSGLVERVSLVGGQLVVRSASQAGCQVVATLPCAIAPADQTVEETSS